MIMISNEIQHHGSDRLNSVTEKNETRHVSGSVKVDVRSSSGRSSSGSLDNVNSKSVDTAAAASGGGAALAATAKHPILPFTDELGNVDEFALKYPLYPACIVTVYQIVRDLHIKQDLAEIEILDGKKWRRNEYFVRAKVRLTGKSRLMVPFYLDAEIDLPWLQDLALKCHSGSDELYICVHTPETIIYELVTTDLP